MLRSPEGCPWDREQTHRSLVPYLIEESFELAEAIENGDDSKIREELGDVLLQVVLHTQIASETGRFDVGDVARGINEKMIRRHPHVFGEKNLDNRQITSNEVLKNWQRIKAEELESTGLNEDSLIEAASKKNPVGKVTGAGFRFDIPISLPALQRASKIGEKTKTNRFDWPDWRGVFNKIEEEYLELKQALEVANSVQHIPKEQSETGPSHDPIAIEIGDLLFTVAQLARHRGIDPEQALRDTNARFERRYGVLKNLAVELEQKDGRGWDARSQEELERLWQAAKSQLREAGLE
jgi:MazG family protein